MTNRTMTTRAAVTIACLSSIGFLIIALNADNDTASLALTGAGFHGIIAALLSSMKS